MNKVRWTDIYSHAIAFSIVFVVLVIFYNTFDGSLHNLFQSKLSYVFVGVLSFAFAIFVTSLIRQIMMRKLPKNDLELFAKFLYITGKDKKGEDFINHTHLIEYEVTETESFVISKIGKLFGLSEKRVNGLPTSIEDTVERGGEIFKNHRRDEREFKVFGKKMFSALVYNISHYFFDSKEDDSFTKKFNKIGGENFYYIVCRLMNLMQIPITVDAELKKEIEETEKQRTRNLKIKESIENASSGKIAEMKSKIDGKEAILKHSKEMLNLVEPENKKTTPKKKSKKH